MTLESRLYGQNDPSSAGYRARACKVAHVPGVSGAPVFRPSRRPRGAPLPAAWRPCRSLPAPVPAAAVIPRSADTARAETCHLSVPVLPQSWPWLEDLRCRVSVAATLLPSTWAPCPSRAVVTLRAYHASPGAAASEIMAPHSDEVPEGLRRPEIPLPTHTEHAASGQNEPTF